MWPSNGKRKINTCGCGRSCRGGVNETPSIVDLLSCLVSTYTSQGLFHYVTYGGFLFNLHPKFLRGNGQEEVRIHTSLSFLLPCGGWSVHQVCQGFVTNGNL